VTLHLLKVAIIGNYLTSKGFKVTSITQPNITTNEITRLESLNLFWESIGAMDYLISNYTALNKFRTNDDLTPDGINNRHSEQNVHSLHKLNKKIF
jgi:radical SAM superfamily enzyme YgiQ (UPF0313 family)